MRVRITLAQTTHLLMIATLCVALWKLLLHNNANGVFAYKSGDQIASTIWETMPDAKRTVVIVNRSGCPFCTASMPFYAELDRVAEEAGVEVVSVTSDEKTTNQSYLELHHVHADRIVGLKDTPLKVSATPTLIVLDASKKVLGAWVGEISTGDEQRVLRLVESGSM